MEVHGVNFLEIWIADGADVNNKDTDDDIVGPNKINLHGEAQQMRMKFFETYFRLLLFVF